MKRLLISLIISSVVLLSAPIPGLSEETNLLNRIAQEEPKKRVLDNGLTVILKRASSSGLVSIDARVKAGSAYEDRLSGSGVAHFVEHMIFKGTKKRGAAEIEREIRSLGGTINGGTSYDYTAFTITIPSEHLGRALDILSDSLLNAEFNPAELEKERSTILKEISLNRDDPIRHISRLLWSTVFKAHPYRHPIIGYEALFRKLSRDDLLEYHKRMYIPNNMALVLVGDIGYEKALKEIEGCFQHIERAPFEEAALPKEKRQISKRHLDVEREVQMAYFALGFPSVSAHNPDMAALDLLSAILGQGESSRLYSNVYRKKNLVYSVGSWNYTPYNPGVFIISGVAEPKKLRLALAAIEEEIRNVKKGDIGADELKRVKTMITADYIYSLQTLSAQARDLAINEITTGDFNFTKRYLENLNSVTTDDMTRVGRTYLNEDMLSVVTIAPPSSKITAEPKEKKKKDYIQRFGLVNDLRYLLREDHRLPIVSMIAVSLGGLRAESEANAGISNLTALMMLKGTDKISEEEISDLVEKMGANLTYFSGNNTFGIRLDLLSKDLDKGLDLFEDILLYPNFPDDILQREKRSVMAAIRATDDDIFAAGMKRFKKLLFSKHPFGFQTIGTVDSVKNLTRDDLKEFHKKYLIPNNMVLAILGDIDTQRLQERINKNFSELEKGPEPEFTTIIEPEQRKTRQCSYETEKEQALVIMGFKGATIQKRDRYVLQLIKAALSGLSGRLSAKLREGLGIAYAVGSISVPALDPGYFALYIATTNNNIELAKKEFLRQIKILNKKGLTQEEIDSAKRELIGKQRISLQTNASLAYQSALDEIYGLGYNHYLEYEKIINFITNRDIIALSRKYLKPNAFNLIILEGRKGD